MQKKPVILTLLGIRPDIIRMFKLIDLLDNGQEEHGYTHVFCHTGQHYDKELDGVFYEELGVRAPDWNMNVGITLKERGGDVGYANQLSLMYEKTAEMLEKFKPDMVLYLGDTNTVLSSVVVARAGVPVIHVEAGGRSFDWRMPEEKNRNVIDHLSDALYCYTERHKINLIEEGVPENRVMVAGNIIYDAIDAFLPKAKEVGVSALSELSLTSKEYVLVTLHREENTSTKEVLQEKIDGLIRLSEEMDVVLPLMPRVRKNLEAFGLMENLENSKVKVTRPLGYLEFLYLQTEAKLIVTDSGTVQEEACILSVPALICRRSTERPESIEIGAAILSENDLYTNAKKALTLSSPWDTMIMNPGGGSPSEKIYADLLQKLESKFFETSHDFANLPNKKSIHEAYGKF